MSKQLVSQRYILKIHTGKLKQAKWDLRLPMRRARRDGYVVAVGDSQIMRWIDERRGGSAAIEENVRETRRQIRELRAQGGEEARAQIRELRAAADNLQFCPDLLYLVIDSTKDYMRANKGFVVNGVRYRRLLGTNGGIKTSTIFFVSERMYPIIKQRIDNGRNPDVPMVPAKLEAYQALVCSGSAPVSMPRGIAVVPDCVTHFKSEAVTITDENDGEPEMKYVPDMDVELKASDGCGLMMPALAERWSAELGLDYVMCGCNTRMAWEKGMVFTFDFQQFADEVAGTRVIKDSWGNEVDLGNVELILTESMLKLWNSYSSLDDYLRNCEENHYTFGVPKVCPKKLDNRRSLNYQFIQSYELTDDEIDELICPTIDMIHDVLRLDWRKTVLYLGGRGMDERSVRRMKDDVTKAIMADRRVMNDPYVRQYVHRLIQKRINDAKIGVIDVHGNFSMMLGDPYALCQRMFGLPVTGLLKAGEIYSRYWIDDGADRVACFRAPMSCHANIRLSNVHRSSEADKWYRYIGTATILNAWDTMCAALNGCDFDGDLVFTTDNRVLVECARPQPALMCAQRNAPKKIPTEDDIIASNIAAFGDEIGKITNRVTSMYDVQAGFSPDSEEYRILDYRIKCGQLYQQNSIDKAKGIISKPMPKSWYDIHAVHQIGDEDQQELYHSVLAEKKPYFMRYIYPDLMKRYNDYINCAARQCKYELNESVEELLLKADGDLTEKERVFLKYYRINMPVGLGDCVMNRICRRVEAEFSNYMTNHPADVFDSAIYKSGTEYAADRRAAMETHIKEYLDACDRLMAVASAARFEKGELEAWKTMAREEFAAQCREIEPDERALCEMMVDICGDIHRPQLVWDVCAPQIVRNLLDGGGGKLSYLEQSEGGEVEFDGDRFTVRQIEVNE